MKPPHHVRTLVRMSTWLEAQNYCCCCSRLLALLVTRATLEKVAAKIFGESASGESTSALASEAQLHAYAWTKLRNIMKPLGYINDQRIVGPSALLLTDLCT